MNFYKLSAALVAVAAMTHGAFAASATNSFNVKVTIAAACTVSAADVNFGTVTGSIAANTTTTANATVTCNKSTPYALSFVTGAGPANGVGAATATMANGANTIPVSLSMSAASQTATGGNDTTAITGKIVAAVNNPVVGTYTVVQSIYVLY
jgi:spore coat protein U-like protein